jgi:trehalose-6-phosphate synthase
MVPEFLHELRPDVRIAFFHHTPFPASDVFNVSPFARELLSSLLSCDFVAFQIPRYCDNFVDAARAQLPLRIKARRACDPRFVSTGSALSVPDMVSELEYSGRSIALGAHPVGIDVRQIRQCVESPEWAAEAEQIRRELPCGKIVVSAECLDPINGTLQKLLAFERFLTLYPAWRGRVSFVDLCTASAWSTASGLLAEVESAAERINQRFRVTSLPSWKPATLVTRRLPWSTHLAYLAAADVMWVTPFRDGLNLSAKEYVSVRQGRGETGAVVLSEFAGASVELEGALLTNPYDIAEMVSTLQQALVMGADEQASRMRRLNEVVETFDLEHWARDFLRAAQKPLNAASLRLRRAAYGRVASR